MKQGNVRSVYYKMSINIGWICIDKNSRIYDIPEGKSLVILGLKYTLVTLLFGWWGFSGIKFKVTLGYCPKSSIQKSLEAININFSGGEDISKMISEEAYDDRTNFVWNNILRKTAESIQKENVEIILEIQDTFNELNICRYSEENVKFILDNLMKINIHNVSRVEVEDIFDALKLYDKE